MDTGMCRKCLLNFYRGPGSYDGAPGTNPKRSFGEQTRMLALRTAICQGARIVRLEGGPKLSVSGFA